ncbi:MAG: hypothetical protein PHF00_10840 [Elusimicrobia bacterium]|nr:hypothetical protein [Elusimicrobiota bacterium]
MRPGTAACWLAAAALIALPLGRGAAQDEAPAIQRQLADLYLGDSLDDVKEAYPPAREWPSVMTPRGGVRRVRIEREYAKSFPRELQTLWLGFKRDVLVEIQAIYTLAYSRGKSADELAGDLALVYGEPRRSNGKSWWSDRSTVLRVFNAELPAGKDGAVELRTSMQVLERRLFRAMD